ncbi:MAG: hypothetical protein MMC33_001109 [Icmadophila ericetorum]|nr:hypothetical protein [Icmadophila ericetorum]
MLYTSSLYRWLQRKRYQYEVTFSLYMLTPIEKFIFKHISTITKRAWFYWAGDEAAGVKSGVLAEQQSTLAMSPAGSDDAWMQREL